MNFSFEEPEQAIIQRSELKPKDPKDQPSRWWRFINGLKTTIGLRPLYLTERFAEAKVCSIETDNQVKLLNAKKDYELAMVEAEKKRQEATLLGAQAREKNAEAHIKELVHTYMETKLLPPEEILEKVNSLLSQFASFGGCAEIKFPELPDLTRLESVAENEPRVIGRPGELAPCDGYFREESPSGTIDRIISVLKGRTMPPTHFKDGIWVGIEVP
jgi:hypothetical protein